MSLPLYVNLSAMSSIFLREIFMAERYFELTTPKEGSSDR